MREEERKWLAGNTRDWSGRGVDPDRDLWEAREEYPDLTIGPYVSMWDVRTVLVRATVTVPLPFLKSPRARVQRIPTRVCVCLVAASAYVGAGNEWLATATDPSDDVSISNGLRHPHVGYSGHICQGEAYYIVQHACGDGRWADALGALQTLLANYGFGTSAYATVLSSEGPFHQLRRRPT